MARRKCPKKIQEVFKTIDVWQKKDSRVVFRTTKKVKSVLTDIWKTRSYPSPSNHNIHINFRSESEYLEFLVRALNQASPQFWYLFMHMLNPDFPDEEK
jgi:hypothetical protein